MKHVSPFLVGLVFGTGLILSGMTNPAKIVAFLDLAGAWDPSLAFVMAGALVVAFAGFRLAARRRTSLSGEPFHPPRASAIDARLILGSLIFGMGWGLVGLCPGPAIADLGFLDGRVGLFVAAMIVGMGLYWGLARLPGPAPLAEASLDG